ncbi:MAG: Hsp20/alpha crystallin family protein [Ruminococcus sp.]|nr:Hsp20/alpha crystallin family protein [Ruminococcus sp.]
MLVPEVFGRNVFDDFFDFPFTAARQFPQRETAVMKTDVKETQEGYELAIDLPGVQKENVKVELDSGYLTVSNTVEKNNDEKDQDGKYIRRERYTGSCSRSFYVGSQVKESDIKAKFENGVLKLDIPKPQPEKAVETKTYIPIEG